MSVVYGMSITEDIFIWGNIVTIFNNYFVVKCFVSLWSTGQPKVASVKFVYIIL